MDYLTLALGAADTGCENASTQSAWTAHGTSSVEPASNSSPSVPAAMYESRVISVESVQSLPVAADVLRAHLAELYPAIHRGCQMGLHRHLERTPAEVVKAILASADPAQPVEVTRETCQMAGEAATLAALIAEYRERLRLLTALGEDVFHEAAALELLLAEEPRP